MISDKEKLNINKYLIGGTLLAILILGCFLRFGALASTVVDTPVRADARDYVFYAYNLSKFHTYSRSSKAAKPDAVRSPGYPIFLSQFLDGDGQGLKLKLENALFAQTLLSAFMVVLVFFIFSPTLGPWLALCVAALTALSPHLISANVYLLTESLFCFLLILYVLSLRQLFLKPSVPMSFVCGVLLGMVALTRPWMQYFIVVVSIWLYFCLAEERYKHRLQVVATQGAGFLVLMMIWVVRNMLEIGAASDSTLFMNGLHHGMYPGMMFDFIPQSFGIPYRFDPQSTEIASSVPAFLNILWQRFSESPGIYIKWYLWGKANLLLSWDIIAGMGDVFVYPVVQSPYFNESIFKLTHGIMKGLHNPIVVLAIIGSLLAWLPARLLRLSVKETWYFRCIVLMFLYFIAIHVIAAPFPRYAVPMRPILYGLALFGFSRLWIGIQYGLQRKQL